MIRPATTRDWVQDHRLAGAGISRNRIAGPAHDHKFQGARALARPARGPEGGQG